MSTNLHRAVEPSQQPATGKRPRVLATPSSRRGCADRRSGIIRHCLLASFLLAICVSGFAAADEFFRQFQAMTNTGSLDLRLMQQRLLVDTNNTGAKLTNTVIGLDRLVEQGELAGIRLGMTMDEVVVRWGKPIRFHPYCYGGPRFGYTDTDLFFTNNTLRLVFLPDAAVFDKGLTAKSSLEDWTRSFAERMRRVGPTNVYFIHAYLESPRCVLTLGFYTNGLPLHWNSRFVELPATHVAPEM